MIEIAVTMHGKRHAFTDKEMWGGDPSDPFHLLDAMEKLPGTFAFYANLLQEARAELAHATESETAARATLAHHISEREEKQRNKKPAEAEVERILRRETDQVLRALEATDGQAEFAGDEALATYSRCLQSRREWAERAGELDVIVETIRLRCAMVRRQAPLLEACLQQNLISLDRFSPPRARGQAPDPRDRITDADDGRITF